MLILRMHSDASQTLIYFGANIFDQIKCRLWYGIPFSNSIKNTHFQCASSLYCLTNVMICCFIQSIYLVISFSFSKLSYYISDWRDWFIAFCFWAWMNRCLRGMFGFRGITSIPPLIHEHMELYLMVLFKAKCFAG